MKYTQIAIRNIGRNRRRSILSITATGIAMMSVVMLFSILSGMSSNLSENLIKYYTGEVRIRNARYEAYEHLQPLHLTVTDSESVIDTVEGVPGVEAVVQRVSTGGAVFMEDRRVGLMINGVDFEREAKYSDLEHILVAGEIPWEGSPAANGNSGETGRRLVPAVVGTGVLDRLGIEIGDYFTVLTRTALRGSNAMSFQVVGVASFPVPALDDMGFWAPMADVQRLLRMPEQAGEVLVKLEKNGDPRDTTDLIRNALGGRASGTNPEDPEALQVEYWKDIKTSYTFIALAQTVYFFMGMIFFVLAATVIINTTMMAIFERKQEIGTLEALGMEPKELIRLFFTESLMLAVIGSVAGLILGVVFSLILGKTGIDFSAAMEGVDMEITPVLYPKINIYSTIGVFFMSIAVGAVTSLFPVRRITKIQPVEALREE